MPWREEGTRVGPPQELLVVVVGGSGGGGEQMDELENRRQRKGGCGVAADAGEEKGKQTRARGWGGGETLQPPPRLG